MTEKPHYNPFVYGNILTKDKILLLGDDPVIARALSRVAKKQHFTLSYTKEYQNIKKIDELRPRLIVLDFSPFARK